MPRYLPLLTALIALALVVLACNDESGPTASPLPPSPQATEPTTQESPATPSKTPPAEATPTAEPSPTAQGSPTAPPTPAAVGTPALAPADLSHYQGQEITEADCVFDPRTAVTDCGSRGLYAVDPPLVGEDISCALLLVQGTPQVVRCTAQQPLQTVYYQIEG